MYYTDEELAEVFSSIQKLPADKQQVLVGIIEGYLIANKFDSSEA